MILATVNTGSIDWQVAASSRDTADAALLEAYQAHCDQLAATTGFGLVDPDTMAECISDGEVTYTDLIVGQVLRDGSPMRYVSTTTTDKMENVR